MAELINPYNTSHPVSDEDLFFGRGETLAWLRESLVRGRRVLVLQGARRIGKSSLLRQLPRHLEQFTFASVDLRGKGREPADELLWQVVSDVIDDLRKRYDLPLVELAREEALQGTRLTDAFLRRLEEQMGVKGLVLAFDDLDALLDEGDEPVATLVASLADAAERLPKLSLLFTVSKDASLNERFPALFGGAAQRKLGPLDRTAARSLITRPVEDTLEYDYGAVKRILELTSAHPYYLQVFCYSLFNRCAKRGYVSLSDVEATLSSLIQGDPADFVEVWEESSPQERAVLATLGALRGAHGIATRREVVTALSRRGVKVTLDEVGETLAALSARDILEKMGAYSYRFHVEMLRVWLARRQNMDEAVHGVRWPAKAPLPEGRPLPRPKPAEFRENQRPAWVIAAVMVVVALLLLARLPSCRPATKVEETIVVMTKVPTATPTPPPPSPTLRPGETPLPTPVPTPTLPLVVARSLPAIAYMSKTEDGPWQIWVMDIDGANRRQITNGPGDNTSPIWSPDGSKIAFVSQRDGNKEIYVMNSDGTEQRNLSNHPADDWTPAWSPDGTHIAFASRRDGNWELYTMKADGSEQTRLTDNPASDLSPVWSPDANEILFSSKRDGNWEIYVMPAEGGEPLNLSNNPATDLSAVWSPDGQLIAFETTRDGDAEVYLMDRNGDNVVNLTNDHTADDHWPCWSPDGHKIVFYSNRTGSWDIYVVSEDGADLVNLTSSAETNDQAPAWRP